MKKRKDTEEKSQKMIELTVERKKRAGSAGLSKPGSGSKSTVHAKSGQKHGKSGSVSDGENPIPEGVVQGKNKTIRRVTLGGLLLVAFMITYIPSLFNWLSGSNVVQDVITNGVIEEYISADAVIIRDEELLDPASIDGICISEIDEGERTAAYCRIAMVTGMESDQLLKSIEDINEKIVKARMEQVEKSDFFSADLAKLDEEIGLRVQELIVACNTKSFGEMGRQRSEIRKIVEKKAEIVAGNSTDGYISSLQQQKEGIQKEINENTKQVRTNVSGIVSYKIDGYERVLTPKTINNLTYDKLEKIIEYNEVSSKETQRVQAGLPFVKVIMGTDIYLAAVITQDKAKAFEVGNNIKLRINNSYLETSGVITNINKEKSDRIVVTVRISRGVESLSDQRVVNVDFITKTEEGLKVPIKSLRDITQDGTKARLMVIRYNVAVNRQVDILCSDEEYAIIKTPEGEYVKTVNLYSIYLINPDNIEEGDIIGK